jgi:L-idonate 5-dehydrogenase
MIEATGAVPALAAGIAAMRPGGIVVQLGLGGDMQVPVQTLTAKELSLVGSFRFHEDFFTGVELMRRGLIDVKPLITDTLPLAEAESAFDAASDRTRAMKMQIGF